MLHRRPIELFITIFIILSLLSCEKSNQIYSRYENGNVKEILIYSKNDSTCGVFKTFYKNGIIKDSATIQNKSINGFKYCFNENGRLVSKQAYLNNKAVGSGYFYNNSGQMYCYTFRMGDEKMIYRVYYNSNSQIIKEEGDYMADVDFVNKELIKGEKQKVNLIIPNPPHLFLRFVYEVRNRYSNKIKYQYEYEMNEANFIIPEKIDSIGYNKIWITIYAKDNLNKTTKSISEIDPFSKY